MKLFSGAISHGVLNKPEACLEPSPTCTRELFAKIVNDWLVLNYVLVLKEKLT